MTPETFAAVDVLARQAAAEGMTTPAAALRFVLDTPGVAELVVAPRTLAQFDAYGFDR
jgi:aryl-alcohol dehydrogenase-like predicted oxidoreductase